MYVGNLGFLDLNNFSTYINGYIRAMDDAEINDISSPEFHGFHEFVRSKFNYYEATAGWANMIKAVEIGLEPENIRWESYDKEMTFEQHKKSIIKFYELLDEYRSKLA